MTKYRIKSYVDYKGTTYYVAEYKPNWWSLWREDMYHYLTEKEALEQIEKWKIEDAKDQARKNRKYTYKEII
jgi:hypothetical protein